MRIKSLTIYCSSSKNLESDFYNLANDLGLFLANKSIKIIYGGGNVGMMGALSNSAISAGGEVEGIIPEFLINIENKNERIAKTLIVDNMSERKKKLFELGDAFLILPGGSGTIEEATEVISWKFLELHNKDIIIFNYKNYWEHLINLYNQSLEKNFSNKNFHDICLCINTLNEFKRIF